MNVELSDLLTCPRCGPAHGLILVPAEVRDRRVESGVLGCPNCRERYPVIAGVADLRVGVGGADPSGASGAAGQADGASGVADAGGLGGVEPAPMERAVRWAALLGLSEGEGTVLVVGAPSAVVAVLPDVVPGVTFVEVSVSAVPPDSGGVVGLSRIRVDEALPFRSGCVRGVALAGGAGPPGAGSLVEEGARVLARSGRLVLDPAPDGARVWVERAGLRVLLEQDEVLVAVRGADA